MRSPDCKAPSCSGRAGMSAAPRYRACAGGRICTGCCVAPPDRPACAAAAASRVCVPFMKGIVYALMCCGAMLTSQRMMHWLASSATQLCPTLMRLRIWPCLHGLLHPCTKPA